MKIVHVHNRGRFSGGEEVMHEAIIGMLRRNDHAVNVVEHKGVSVGAGLWIKMRAFKEGIYSRSAKRSFFSTLSAERPDVVHVHNLYPFLSPSILTACREKSVPVVMHVHNYRLICPIDVSLRNGTLCELCDGGREYRCALNNCRGNIFESIGYAARAAMARRWRLFHDNVTLFLPPSHFVKRRLVNAGFPEEQIVVLPNMVSVPVSGVDSSGGQYIAYSGRLSPTKGVGTLLGAARHTRLPVRLAGDGPIMTQLVDEAPKNAKFLGFLDRHQIVNFYRGARFTVVPSTWWEVFGLTGAESMSHGLPVIASRIGSLPEIVDEGYTGLLFEPGNAEDLARQMKLLWENPELCRQMSLAGREKAVREYSEEVYYKRLMAVYERAIELGRAWGRST